MIRLFLAALCVVCFSANVEARPRHGAAAVCVETGTIFRPSCNGPQAGVFAPARMSRADQREARRVARGKMIADEMGIGGVAPRPAVRAPKARHGASEFFAKTANISAGRSIAGVVAPLAAKVTEILGSCSGARVVAVNVGHSRYIRGSRIVSLHKMNKAVDVSGDPSCVYAMLHGWAGGYSTDYGRMGHVHVSYDAEGGREMGARFVHGGGHRHAGRYASRHRHRYAAAGR